MSSVYIPYIYLCVFLDSHYTHQTFPLVLMENHCDFLEVKLELLCTVLFRLALHFEILAINRKKCERVRTFSVLRFCAVMRQNMLSNIA